MTTTDLESVIFICIFKGAVKLSDASFWTVGLEVCLTGAVRTASARTSLRCGTAFLEFGQSELAADVCDSLLIEKIDWGCCNSRAS